MPKYPDARDSDRLDKRIRRHLAAGKTQREIARLVGIDLANVNRRIDKARGEWRVIEGRTE